LKELVTNPDPYASGPERQAELLDCLLYSIMHHSLTTDKKRPGCFIQQEDLENILRIQKQYLDTAKTVGVLDYMSGLIGNMAKTPYIHPFQRIREEKEKFEAAGFVRPPLHPEKDPERTEGN